MNYYIKTNKIRTSFEQAVQLVNEACYAEGFVVLTEVNMHDKFKENLGIHFRKYKILSAYNPDYAYKALLEDDKIGVMLPCNIIIQEDTDGTIEIAAGNPVASMFAVENPELIDIAIGIEVKLEKIIDKLNDYPQAKYAKILMHSSDMLK